MSKGVSVVVGQGGAEGKIEKEGRMTRMNDAPLERPALPPFAPSCLNLANTHLHTLHRYNQLR